MSGVDPVAFADLLAGYCLDVQPGEHVQVKTTALAAPLVLELQRAILEREAWPLLRVEVPGVSEGFVAHARDAQLDGLSALALAEAQGSQKSVSIQAPADTRALDDADPDRLARMRRARRPLSEAAMAGRWCTTLWPTAALAEQASMTLDDYGAFVAGALFLDDPRGPQAAWEALGARQATLVERLAGAQEIRIEAEGTDVTLAVGGRRWVNSDGRRNMPSGEVFTGPHETSAEGTVRFTIPSSPSGLQISGVELTFRDGEVVAARAQEGDEHLQRMLATDAGARRLGELGIGTNTGIDRPTGTILFDEKIGGTVHLALGRSYPETGGINDSALHWDLICDLRDGGRISVDGEVLDPLAG